ncbi:MAG: ABC transporter substrate-binding protein [Clostridiales bacterium]|nr:ABC transporter substrate-binding protein [Clostridiales bacterium]
MKKKMLSILMALAMTTVIFTGCGSSSSSTSDSESDTEAAVEADTEADAAEAADAEATVDADAKIGVVAMVENGAFTDMRDGIIQELEANGYSEDQIEYQCAQGDSSALSTIVSNMTDGTYDAVFTIATPATQAFVNVESDTPVFFCAVSAPVAAGVLTDMDAPDKNATGTSNAIPVSEIIDLAEATTPATKYGLIYSGNEDNAINTVEQCEEYLDTLGIEYTVATAPTSSDVETAVNALITDGADVIFVPNDSIIQDGVDVLVDICNENQIPTYASSTTTVASGCFATLAIDDVGIGEKTVDIALEYLQNGTPVAEIPAQVIGIDYCSVSQSAMDALGLTESDIVTEYALNVIE